MAIFGSKPWVNPFRRMSIFRLFEFLVFIAQKGAFSFYNIIKDIFQAYIAQKKLEKWTFLEQNHVLSHLEKCQFFDFLNFFVIFLTGIFWFQNVIEDIFVVYIAQKKRSQKNGHFWPKLWLNPFGKTSIVRLF